MPRARPGQHGSAAGTNRPEPRPFVVAVLGRTVAFRAVQGVGAQRDDLRVSTTQAAGENVSRPRSTSGDTGPQTPARNATGLVAAEMQAWPETPRKLQWAHNASPSVHKRAPPEDW